MENRKQDMILYLQWCVLTRLKSVILGIRSDGDRQAKGLNQRCGRRIDIRDLIYWSIASTRCRQDTLMVVVKPFLHHTTGSNATTRLE